MKDQGLFLWFGSFKLYIRLLSYLSLVTLVQYEHKKNESSLSPFVFVCDDLLNLLTFKPWGWNCSRYCTKHEACASRPHLNLTCMRFSSSSMIKTFIFYLNGELTGYQWFPQDTGSVGVRLRNAVWSQWERSIDMWSSHNAPLLGWKELTVCTSVWERKWESL